MIKNDFKIDFEHKRIYYNPEGSGTVYTVNEFYSFLQDTFDEPENMKYDIPIEAKSKTEFSLINGWIIDEEGRKFLKGGTLLDWVIIKYDGLTPGRCRVKRDYYHSLGQASGETSETWGYWDIPSKINFLIRAW